MCEGHFHLHIHRIQITRHRFLATPGLFSFRFTHYVSNPLSFGTNCCVYSATQSSVSMLLFLLLTENCSEPSTNCSRYPSSPTCSRFHLLKQMIPADAFLILAASDQHQNNVQRTSPISVFLVSSVCPVLFLSFFCPLVCPCFCVCLGVCLCLRLSVSVCVSVVVYVVVCG